MKTDLSVLPKVKDVYVTMLPGNDFREVAKKAKELVQSGFNPVPHFPARSIKNLDELKQLKVQLQEAVNSFDTSKTINIFNNYVEGFSSAI